MGEFLKLTSGLHKNNSCNIYMISMISTMLKF